MKPCWHEHGLTDKGAALADGELHLMMEIVGRVGPGVAAIVLAEADFRVNVLPTRAEAYRKKYIAENGE